MQISEKSINDTVDFVLDRFRRDSLVCLTEFLLDIDYYDVRSQLRGIRLLFLDCPSILFRINAAIDETYEIKISAIQRLSSIQSSDLGRSPALSPVEVGQEGNQIEEVGVQVLPPCESCDGTGLEDDLSAYPTPGSPDYVDCIVCAGSGFKEGNQ